MIVPLTMLWSMAPEMVDERSQGEASLGEESKAPEKTLKKVASLIERFEANESVQREWEHSNAKQNSVQDQFLSDLNLKSRRSGS